MMLKLSFLVLSLSVTSVFCGQVIPSDKHRYHYISWPTLRGQPIDRAAAHIHSEYPQLRIKVLSDKYGIPSTILPNTVLIYESEDGIVQNLPESLEEIPIELTIWPEVVGLGLEKATEIILKEMPDAKIRTVVRDNEATGDLDSNRVRIIVDSNDIVVDTPRSG